MTPISLSKLRELAGKATLGKSPSSREIQANAAFHRALDPETVTKLLDAVEAAMRVDGTSGDDLDFALEELHQKLSAFTE